MAEPKTREQLRHLKFLQEKGYEIPKALVGLVQEAEWKRRGVVEVWNCKCGIPYESPVPIKQMVCPLGHSMKKSYPK